MGNYSDYEQSQMDIASGEESDRHAEQLRSTAWNRALVHHRLDGFPHPTNVVPFRISAKERKPAMTLTAERVDELARAYTRESLLDLINNGALNVLPITIGTGPFDHDATTSVCELCPEPFVPQNFDGAVTAMGYGVWARGETRFLRFHVKCYREAELSR